MSKSDTEKQFSRIPINEICLPWNTKNHLHQIDCGFFFRKDWFLVVYYLNEKSLVLALNNCTLDERSQLQPLFYNRLVVCWFIVLAVVNRKAGPSRKKVQTNNV